jgi:hypothetical protein
MRIFVAFLVMGTMALAVALIVAAEALVAALPFLAVALLVVALLRLLDRRDRAHHRPAQVPVAPLRPATPWPAAWVLVPAQMVRIEPPRPPVIDIDVLGENGTRRE